MLTTRKQPVAQLGFLQGGGGGGAQVFLCPFVHLVHINRVTFCGGGGGDMVGNGYLWGARAPAPPPPVSTSL